MSSVSNNINNCGATFNGPVSMGNIGCQTVSGADSIDWNKIIEELDTLQSAKSSLSSDMQAITDELTEAAKEKNESAFKTICKKIGQSALSLIESLGLNFISCFIKGIM